MNGLQSALKSYQAAREEILLRIRLRDYVLLVHLAVTGTMLGISLRPSPEESLLLKEILLVIPFLALGVAILLAQHNLAIGFLGKFCVEEVGCFLRSTDPPGDVPQWDNSKAFEQYSKSSETLRTWGQSVVILIPCVLGLSVNKVHIFSPFPFGILWWFGLVAIGSIIFIAFKTHIIRTNQYSGRWAK